MAEGYKTYDGKTVEFEDVKTLFIGEYQDIASGRNTGYWVENYSTDLITENIYEALEDKGAQVSDDVKYTYNNENTDFPVAFDDINQVYIERIVDIDTGEAIDFKATYNDFECRIREDTYEALKDKGAVCYGEE